MFVFIPITLEQGCEEFYSPFQGTASAHIQQDREPAKKRRKKCLS